MVSSMQTGWEYANMITKTVCWIMRNYADYTYITYKKSRFRRAKMEIRDQCNGVAQELLILGLDFLSAWKLG